MDLITGSKAEKEVLRRKRKPLLEAFDIYKSNVEYGVLEETEAEHLNILAWYRLALDLDKDAIGNPPAEIEKYLRK